MKTASIWLIDFAKGWVWGKQTFLNYKDSTSLVVADPSPPFAIWSGPSPLVLSVSTKLFAYCKRLVHLRDIINWNKQSTLKNGEQWEDFQCQHLFIGNLVPCCQNNVFFFFLSLFLGENAITNLTNAKKTTWIKHLLPNAKYHNTTRLITVYSPVTDYIPTTTALQPYPYNNSSSFGPIHETSGNNTSNMTRV